MTKPKPKPAGTATVAVNCPVCGDEYPVTFTVSATAGGVQSGGALRVVVTSGTPDVDALTRHIAAEHTPAPADGQADQDSERES